VLTAMAVLAAASLPLAWDAFGAVEEGDGDDATANLKGTDPVTCAALA
jgi:hypothetical protein